MGKSKFSPEAEKKFLELWHGALVSTDKKMQGRQDKVAYVTRKLNSYLNEIGSKELYNESQVNNKVDTAKAKGKELYRKYFKKSTGSSNGGGDGDDDVDDDGNAVDLQAAFSQWANFRTYHQYFRKHPSWGQPVFVEVGTATPPAASLSTPAAASLSSSDSSSSSTSSYSATSSAASAPATSVASAALDLLEHAASQPLPKRRPPLSTAPSDNETNVDDSFFGAVDDCSPPSPAADGGVDAEDVFCKDTASTTNPSTSTINPSTYTPVAKSVAAKTGVTSSKRQQTQSSFLQEMKDMNFELQRRQFEHDHKMQTQWTEYMDKRDAEKEKQDVKRHKEDLEAAAKIEQNQEKHAQAMEQDRMKFMAALMEKYNL